MKVCIRQRFMKFTKFIFPIKLIIGGGLAHEGEFIDVVEMTIPELKKFIEQDSVPSPGGFLFAILWFFNNKAPKD